MTLEPDYRYILDPKPIGRGTFSQTQRATIAMGESQSPPAGCQDAIVKTLAPHLHELPDFWRFKRYFSKLARRLADCRHPHLVRVIDYFEEEEQPYVVYEAVSGRSLAEILETRGALSVDLALRYIEQVAGAIATLHTAGLLHLDLSPSTIIQRDDRDEVVAIEFGLTAELTPAIKQTRANLLSPGYAAPEQHQPEALCTPATDIYALSATLYALLAGSPPPPAPLLELIDRDRWQQFPAYLPDCIKRTILQGLSLDPQQRPQSVEAWQALLKGTVARSEEVVKPIQRPALQRGLKRAKSQEKANRKPENFSANATPPLPVQEPIAQKAEEFKLENLDAVESETLEESIVNTAETDDLSSFLFLKTERKPENLETSETSPQNGKQALTLKELQATKMVLWWFSQSNPNSSAFKPKFPMRALLVTCAIAASAGAGLGISVRVNRPDEAGSSVWHLKQSFPPRNSASPTIEQES